MGLHSQVWHCMSHCARNKVNRFKDKVLYIVTSVITPLTGLYVHLYAGAQVCLSYSVTALQWLLHNRGQSKLHNYYIRQIQQLHNYNANFTHYFPTLYSGMPSILFPISACFCLFPFMRKYILIQILSTLSYVVDGDGWIQLSSVMVATDHFLVPPHETTDSSEVIMSISSMSKSACVLLNEHLHGCTHNVVAARAIADVGASAWRLSRCLLHARLYCEKKHKADWRAHMDHLETIILRKVILRPFVLSLDSSPCPSVPISSLKEVYSSCLFFGVISVKMGEWI